jgi:aspartate/methionine/tyrosine aminotransferase
VTARLGGSDTRRLDNRRRQIVAALEVRGWSVWPDPDGRQWAFPPIRLGDGPGRRVALPATLSGERQARNLETALRSIGPYPREER